VWAASALIMLRQIDLFCVPRLADTGCLEADHNGGLASRLRLALVTDRDRSPLPALRWIAGPVAAGGRCCVLLPRTADV
jgi:hypothetical protein